MRVGGLVPRIARDLLRAGGDRVVDRRAVGELADPARCTDVAKGGGTGEVVMRKVHPLLQSVDRAPARVGGGERPAERNGLVEVGHRPIRIVATHDVGVAAVAVGRCQLRIEPDRLGEIGDGAVIFLAGDVLLSTAVVREGRPGIVLQYAGAGGNRLVP
jgi:hypothetical protein